MHKLWNAEKKADLALAWWAENSKCAYQEAFRDLDRALRDFVKSWKGERRGRRLGFPRFKKRGRCTDSFRLYGSLRRCRGAVALPRIGTIKTCESTRKLGRRLEDGTVPGPRPLAAGARLARLHARIANLRNATLHKATSMLGARYETVVVEDRNVAGMTRNRRLARAIADQGFGQARRMLSYKTTWRTSARRRSRS